MSARIERRSPKIESRRWPHRLAVATLLAAIPLVAFGGTVTSLDAGMAIDGWLVLEPGRGDHFLFAYPLEKWFRDAGTFVEHTHRLFGSLVGLLAIATLAGTLSTGRSGATRRSGAARFLSAAALLAVCAQGALGGFRVLENSPSLAFVHGAVGQAVFALLAAQALFLSSGWETTAPSACKHARRLHRLSVAAVALVSSTIFLGAWLRHGGALPALVLHGLGVLASSGILLALCAELRATAAAGAAGGTDRSRLLRVRARLLAMLAAQILLGALSFWIVFVAVGPSVQAVHQSVVPTLHVLMGALLLAQTVAAAMWSQRVVATGEPAGVVAVCASLGGAS